MCAMTYLLAFVASTKHHRLTAAGMLTSGGQTTWSKTCSGGRDTDDCPSGHTETREHDCGWCGWTLYCCAEDCTWVLSRWGGAEFLSPDSLVTDDLLPILPSRSKTCGPWRNGVCTSCNTGRFGSQCSSM